MDSSTGGTGPNYLHNFRAYWREHLVHLGVGGTAGVLLVSGEPWAGAVIMATVWERQALEFQKRRDTPGIDLSYHLAGLVTGVLARFALKGCGATW